MSPLDHRPRAVAVAPGERFSGLRLAPGAVIDARALSRLWRDDDDLNAVADSLSDAVRIDTDTVEAMMLIAADSRPMGHIAATLGVSLRSLQRHIAERTEAPLGFWRGLARARRCARLMLTQPDPLAEIAFASGYADQAHMSRDIRRWFGQTPMALRRDAALARQLLQPGWF